MEKKVSSSAIIRDGFIYPRAWYTAMVTVVILDSNFLFVPLQFKIDIFHEIPRLVEGSTRLVIPRGVIDEMNRIASGNRGYQRGRDARTALLLAEGKQEHGGVIVLDVPLDEGEPVDDYVIRIALEMLQDPEKFQKEVQPVEAVVIATNDKEVKEKAIENVIRIIELRGKTQLAFR
ncbi:hypothetical protein GF325_08440 [Candidatus Bathyarchaeota archaeon]|nr:hypothetical protein [Candidatus Bathyarchaeota archaeon]